ncbi:MAG TPA: Fur family transcriptional regulator [Ktedonobacteraceae bacterium]|jgi:Fur family ferric uptake transcriptional regulator|nr:Fur family transcriptional regulator [Ktedonobacteraceae bacterium]
MQHRLEEEMSVEQRLRAAHLKVTRPRRLVLSLLRELGGHHSVDQLVEELRKRDTPLPRASVYNAIDILVSHEIVMLADAGPGPALYEENEHWHHHFVCVDCGIVINIACVKGEKPCLLPEWVPGTVEEAQIIFRGHCSCCLAKAGANGQNEQIGPELAACPSLHPQPTEA